MNIVFIPNISTGDGRNTPYHYSVKSWEKWAEQFDDIEVIEWADPIMDVKKFPIIYQREWALDILDHNKVDYDQVLIVDADTIVHPDCPNFFLETEHKYAGVINNGCYEWVTRSIRGWGELYFPEEPKVKCWDYFNTGFIIVNKKHKPFFKEIQKLYTEDIDKILRVKEQVKAGTGQTIVNFLLQKHGIETKKLKECYNLQDIFNKNLLHLPHHSWFSDELLFLEAGWVYHFNAIPKNHYARDVGYWMKRTYKHLYK